MPLFKRAAGYRSERYRVLAKLRLRTKLFLLVAFVLAGTVLAGAYGMFALHESRLAADRSLRDS